MTHNVFYVNSPQCLYVTTSTTCKVLFEVFLVTSVVGLFHINTSHQLMWSLLIWVMKCLVQFIGLWLSIVLIQLGRLQQASAQNYGNQPVVLQWKMTLMTPVLREQCLALHSPRMIPMWCQVQGVKCPFSTWWHLRYPLSLSFEKIISENR